MLSEKEENVVAANQKSQMTRLKTIKGISITKIGMRQLCLFANKVGIKGMRNKQKCDVCAAIVESITTGG